MSLSTRQDDDTAQSDDNSSDSDEGWSFLLGGLLSKSMSSTIWESNEDEKLRESCSSRNKGTILQRIGSNHRVGKKPNEAISRESHQNQTSVDDYVETTVDAQEQSKEQMIFERAFYISPIGQILKPPVQIVDCSSEKKGNVLIATKHFPKGSIIFTEKALEGIQVPSSSPTKGNLCAIRGCQNCFKSLEPASCLSSKDLPFSELWPVEEYDSSTISMTSDIAIIVGSVEYSKLSIHPKSGRITCRNCGVIFCNRSCAKNCLEAIGDCCSYIRAIEGLVQTMSFSEKELSSSINDDGEECTSFVEINPVLILAARMFIAQVQQYRSGDDRSEDRDTAPSQSLFHGLCGDAKDMRALGFGPPPRLENDVDNAAKIPQPLQHEYEAVANAIGLTEAERISDSRCSLQQFQKIVAIAQRNSISLTTGSPFRTYYQAMIRKTGGRGSIRQQEVVSIIARLLGSKEGKLAKDMDRIIEDKCVVEMGGIFTLTARMNHSCDPNAEIRGQEYVDCNIDIVAKQEINAGEEICISYLNLGANPSHSAAAKNRRRRELSSRYLFNCQCSRCIG